MKLLNFSRIARTLVVVGAVGAAAAASALVASPAHAAPTGHHCIIVLPSTSVARCFDTFDQAKQFAETVESVGPSKGEAAAAARAEAIRSVAPAFVTLTRIGIEYDLPLWNQFGDSRWVYGTGGSCTTPVNNVDYSIPDWAVYGFDQRISSFQTFSNCWAKHFDLVNFNLAGLAVGFQGSQAVINAALNNDTSSEQWS